MITFSKSWQQTPDSRETEKDSSASHDFTRTYWKLSDFFPLWDLNRGSLHYPYSKVSVIRSFSIIQGRKEDEQGKGKFKRRETGCLKKQDLNKDRPESSKD